jgi:hypothetical protein
MQQSDKTKDSEASGLLQNRQVVKPATFQLQSCLTELCF